MGLFQQTSEADVKVVDSTRVDDKLRLLSRLPSVVFDQIFRGLDPLAVDRLLDSIAAHEPNLRAGFEHRRVHGDWPVDASFQNSVAVLQNVSCGDIPSAFRGSDPMQVQRVLDAVRELPTHMERD